jgi:sulfatase modifying factor 1
MAAAGLSLRGGARLLLVVLAAGSAAFCARPRATWIEPVTGMEFVRVPAGRFRMGSPPAEPGHEAWEVAHEVVIARAFAIGRTEVTQGQWERVMGSNPSRFADGGPRFPVEQVDWYEVHEFLSRLERLAPGSRFRLPTEAEWEYACRAGTTSAYSTGARLSTDQANYDGRYPLPGQDVGRYLGRPAPVASYPANDWGLFDLHGNVWEWCEDDFCPYGAEGEVDPLRRCDSGRKVIRGGSWTFNADSARSAVRYSHRPQDRGPSLGFRVVREPLPAALGPSAAPVAGAPPGREAE